MSMRQVLSPSSRFTLQIAALLALALLAHAREPVAAQSTPVLPPGAQVTKLSGDFQFTEGPVWDGKATLYFSDIPNKKIHTWTETDGIGTFRELPGSCNGLRIDADGNLYVCQPTGRAVIRISADGTQSTAAEEFGGKRLNSPNDLWIDPQGGIFFTDPRYGSQEDLQQGGFHVYYLPADGGSLKRVLSDLVKPNGVIGSADGKHLYVADAGAGKTYRYDIQDDGKLSNRRLAADSGSDGLALDDQGNLYVTASSKGNFVTAYDPDGKVVVEIPVPERPANITFGGKDGQTLFITAREGLYAIPTNVRDGSTPRYGSTPK